MEINLLILHLFLRSNINNSSTIIPRLTSNRIILLFVGIVALALALGNPMSTEWPLKCPLFWLTGWQCPLCGMQRMVHELLHLRIASAWHYNSVLLLTSPYWLLMLVGQLKPEWQTTNRIVRFCYRNSVILAMVCVMIGWGIVRNFSN